MADRGEYRAIHVALIDDPDFLQLSPPARLALITLKLILGVSGIDVVRALVPELVATTGHDEATIRAAVDELQAGRWILTEGRVVWLRNGLRYEPSKPLASENGQKGISGHLETLPRVALVNRFADYYGLPRPFPELGDPTDPEGATEPPSDPLPTPSEPPTEAGIREEGIGKRDRHPSSSSHVRDTRDTREVIPLRVAPAAEPDAPATGPPDRETLVSDVIRAANRAMSENPAIDPQRLRPIPTSHGSRQDVLDWLDSGIPPDVILAAVEERAREYRPDGHHRQISTMAYFNGAVREAWERRQNHGEPNAHDHPRGPTTQGRRAAAGARAVALGAGDPSRRSGWVYE